MKTLAERLNETKAQLREILEKYPEPNNLVDDNQKIVLAREKASAGYNAIRTYGNHVTSEQTSIIEYAEEKLNNARMVLQDVKNPHLENCVDLHPDYIDWKHFLKNVCELRDTHNGCKVYNTGNCFYFVDQNGFIVTHYGYQAQYLWNKFKGEKFFDSQVN